MQHNQGQDVDSALSVICCKVMPRFCVHLLNELNRLNSLQASEGNDCFVTITAPLTPCCLS